MDKTLMQSELRVFYDSRYNEGYKYDKIQA